MLGLPRATGYSAVVEARTQEGQVDHRIFLKHFLASHGALKAYLLASTGNANEAEELLQEVSSTLWEKFGQYDAARPFLPWSLGFARIEVLRRRERFARTRQVLSQFAVESLMSSAGEVADELDDRRIHLRDCVEGLADEPKQIVRLRYLESLPIADLAGRIGKSVAAVEMALVRARRALRQCIEQKLADV